MLVKSAFSQPMKHMNKVSLLHSNATEEIGLDQLPRACDQRNVDIGKDGKTVL